MKNKNEAYLTEGIEGLTFECIKEATKRAKIKKIENLAFECVKEATKKANTPPFIKFIEKLGGAVKNICKIKNV